MTPVLRDPWILRVATESWIYHPKHAKWGKWVGELPGSLKLNTSHLSGLAETPFGSELLVSGCDLFFPPFIVPNGFADFTKISSKRIGIRQIYKETPSRKEWSKLKKIKFLNCFLRIPPKNMFERVQKIPQHLGLLLQFQNLFLVSHFGRRQHFRITLASELAIFFLGNKHQQKISLERTSWRSFPRCADRKLGEIAPNRSLLNEGILDIQTIRENRSLPFARLLDFHQASNWKCPVPVSFSSMMRFKSASVGFWPMARQRLAWSPINLLGGEFI